jgi:hypothetical protein
MQPEDFFAGHPDARAVFEKVRSILTRLGPVGLRSAAVVVAWYTDSWVDLRECVVDRCARVLLGGGVVAGQELVVASSMILLGGSSPRVA